GNYPQDSIDLRERGNDHQADERVVKPSRDDHASVKPDVHSGSRYSPSRNEIAFDQTRTPVCRIVES
ncbi:hypothetical protein NPIL_548701, partial [Nephila pilipes]